MNRRRLLTVGLVVPAGVVVASLVGCAPAETAGCVDAGALSLAEAGLRRSMSYAEQSADPARTCSGCAFFVPGDDGTPCGACQLFDGGPVNPNGRCDSWSAA